MGTIRPKPWGVVFLFVLPVFLQFACSDDEPVRSTDVTPPAATTLQASMPDSTRVYLRWVAPGDDGDEGQAATYDLRYAPWLITAGNFESAPRWTELSGPGGAGEMQAAMVRGLANGTTYWFALRTADEQGNWSEVSPVISTTTRGSHPDDGHWTGEPIGQPGLFGDVLALATYREAMVAGGGFPGMVVRWDGEHWTPLAEEFEGLWVMALATFQGDLIAAGDFSTGAPLNYRGIAAWNDSAWSPLGIGLTDAGPDAEIRALAVFDDRLIAAGDFSEMGGVACSNIAAWNGSAWAPLGDGVNAKVNALAVLDGKLYAGGAFTASGTLEAAHVTVWDGAGWSAVGAGFQSPVTALTLFEGALVAASGNAPGRIARWGGGSWSDLDGGETFNCVLTLAEHDGRLYVGGMFGHPGGTYCPSSFRMIAAWDGEKWHPLGSGLSSPTEDAGVAALLSHDDALHVGGVFFQAGADSALCIARWED